jgi:serine/threonine-protein kinase
VDEQDQDTIITDVIEKPLDTGKQELPKIKTDRYDIKRLIGKGGMGEIYKAYDPRLKRFVALKFLWHANPENVKRFLREAQAQAKVKHENICKVYEVGEAEGKSYIAMQYIDGKALDKKSPDMTLEQKVKIVKQAAEALHEAHRMGLIHRDIKPGNIIIEQQKNGELKPFILDFGVAREVADPRLTTTGVVMGTPGYMAPEQARGDHHKVDRRTDIYALGVTLYQLLSDKIPFTGDNPIDVIMKVINDEALRLNRVEPAVPQDLNTIVMKCIEKDPSRRYDSARSLAEDLQRYLDDEPILAKQTSRVYRLKKRIRKHKTLSAVILIAMLIILVLAGFGVNVLMESRERAAIAHWSGQKIKEFETIMRFAYMRPLHNTSREKEIVKQKIKEIIEEMNRAGSVAEGPAHYVLGRGFMSLHDIKKARLYLEKAWTDRYREPHVAYALGLVLGRVYQRELEELEGIKDQKLLRERMREIVRNYRLPALKYLKLSQGVSLETPFYIEGLMAFYEDRYNKALKYTRNAYDQAPWLYEAHRLEGDIHAKIARNKRRSGEIEDALIYYEDAEKSYEIAIAVARSDPLSYGGLAVVRAGMLTLHMQKGKPAGKLMEKLQDACNHAVAADPDFPALHIPLANAYLVTGEYHIRSGTDPTEALDRAAVFLEKVEKSGETGIEFMVSKARYHFLMGWLMLIDNQDPRPSFQQTREILDDLLNKRPGLSGALELQEKMEKLLKKR